MTAYKLRDGRILRPDIDDKKKERVVWRIYAFRESPKRGAPPLRRKFFARDFANEFSTCEEAEARFKKYWDYCSTFASAGASALYGSEKLG